MKALAKLRWLIAEGFDICDVEVSQSSFGWRLVVEITYYHHKKECSYVSIASDREGRRCLDVFNRYLLAKESRRDA